MICDIDNVWTGAWIPQNLEIFTFLGKRSTRDVQLEDYDALGFGCCFAASVSACAISGAGASGVGLSVTVLVFLPLPGGGG